jgi:RNA polymerase sigma-70 factor (sigma-E family)
MDDAEFSAFVQEALPALLRFGHVLTGDPLRAEDLVQAALVSTYARWGRAEVVQPHAYVRRAMVNAYTSWWRRSRRETALPPGWDVPAPDPPDGAERDRTLQALRALPPRQRAVVVLRWYEDLSEAEIAEALGCSRGTVKSQSSRALRTLRRLLQSDDLERTPR